MTIVNGFELLTISIKLSILGACGSPGCASIWSLYVTKSSITDIMLDPRSGYVTDAMIVISKMAIFRAKLLLGFLSKIHLPSPKKGNLVKELHLSCCSSPRFTTFQICRRKKSQDNIFFKYFKE